MGVIDGKFDDLLVDGECLAGFLEDAGFDVVVVDVIGLIGEITVDNFVEERVFGAVGLEGVVVDGFFEEGGLGAVGLDRVVVDGFVVDDFFEEGVLEASGLRSRCGMDGDG